MVMSRRQRVLVLAAMLVVGVVAARIATPSVGHVRAPLAACGFERWSVKTLQDRPRLVAMQRTTVAWLVSRPAPDGIPAGRLPLERRIFQVVGAVRFVRREDDSDLHVVLAARGRHMIVEAPLPACAARATPLRRRQMARARRSVRLCAKARVTGVAFFDTNHGQTGVAPNAIELHPVLAFRCLAG
jgi:hypothetical protein